MIKFIQKHVWLVILILSFILVPQSISSQSEINQRVLITGIAIDGTDNEDVYKVTAQVLLPSGESEGTQAVLNFVSASSKTISEAIEIISTKLGKSTGLSHLNYVLVGESIYKNKNMMMVLDPFIRDERISKSVSFYCTEGDASKQIIKTKNLQLSSAIGIENVYTMKEKTLNGIMVPVYKYISDGLSDSGAQMVSDFSITEENLEEDENTSSDQKTNNNSRIKYYNNVNIFKKGDFLHKIENEKSLKGVFLLNKNCSEGILEVDGVDSDVFKNAKMAIHLKNKKVSYKPRFENGIPVLTIEIQAVNSSVREIQNANIKDDNYYANKNYFTEEANKKLSSIIENYIDSAIEETKNYADVFGFENAFNMYRNSEYKKYKNDEFFKNIRCEYDIKIKANE